MEMGILPGFQTETLVCRLAECYKLISDMGIKFYVRNDVWRM